MENKRINKYVSNTYMKFAGFGALAYWFGNYIKTYYGAFFITDVLLLSPAVYSLITAINSVMSFFIAPVIGGIVDSGKQGKWGKYRKFLIIGPVAHSLFFTLSYLPVTDNSTLLTIWLICFWVLTQISGQLIIMPYYALHAKIAETPNQRTQFVAKRNFFVNVASLLYSVSYAAIIGFFTNIGGSQQWGYAGFVILSSILSALLFFLEFKAIGPVEEQIMLDYSEPEIDKSNANKGPTIKDFIVNIATNLPFALVSVQQFAFGFCASIRNMFYVYYYNYILMNPSLYSVYVFLNSWMGIAATLTLPYIAKKLENTQIAFYSFIIEFVMGIAMKFTLLSAPWVALVLSMVFRYCSIIVGSINASMFQDTAVYAEWKNGADTMATIIGGSQIIGTISGLITSALYGVILIGTGYVAGQPITTEVSSGIINALAIYPAIVALVAAICAKLNPLTNEKLMQYKTEIDERKGKISIPN